MRTNPCALTFQGVLARYGLRPAEFAAWQAAQG